jgi:hypothetical protein
VCVHVCVYVFLLHCVSCVCSCVCVSYFTRQSSGSLFQLRHTGRKVGDNLVLRLTLGLAPVSQVFDIRSKEGLRENRSSDPEGEKTAQWVTGGLPL